MKRGPYAGRGNRTGVGRSMIMEPSPWEAAQYRAERREKTAIQKGRGMRYEAMRRAIVMMALKHGTHLLIRNRDGARIALIRYPLDTAEFVGLYTKPDFKYDIRVMLWTFRAYRACVAYGDMLDFRRHGLGVSWKTMRVLRGKEGYHEWSKAARLRGPDAGETAGDSPDGREIDPEASPVVLAGQGPCENGGT